jgi:hypothetical protein
LAVAKALCQITSAPVEQICAEHLQLRWQLARAGGTFMNVNDTYTREPIQHVLGKAGLCSLADQASGICLADAKRRIVTAATCVSEGLAPGCQGAPMHKYYFHLHERSGVVRDEEGQELANDTAARKVAVTNARGIMAEDVQGGHLELDGFIEVTDEAGEPLLRVSYMDAVTVRLPEALLY